MRPVASLRFKEVWDGLTHRSLLSLDCAIVDCGRCSDDGFALGAAFHFVVILMSSADLNLSQWFASTVECQSLYALFRVYKKRVSCPLLTWGMEVLTRRVPSDNHNAASQILPFRNWALFCVKHYHYVVSKTSLNRVQRSSNSVIWYSIALNLIITIEDACWNLCRSLIYLASLSATWQKLRC